MNVIENLLLTLNMKGAIQEYLSQNKNLKSYDLTFEERLCLILESEILYKDNRRIHNAMKKAKFKKPIATLSSVDLHTKRGLEPTLFKELAKCDFIKHKHNIVITGPTGMGKSFLSEALGKEAIYRGYTVKYFWISELIEEVHIQRDLDRYSKYLENLKKIDLMIIDDFGARPLSIDDESILFEIIGVREDIASIIFASQVPVENWVSCMKNKTLADAIVDRLTHGSIKIELDGDSMRKNKQKK